MFSQDPEQTGLEKSSKLDCNRPCIRRNGRPKNYLKLNSPKLKETPPNLNKLRLLSLGLQLQALPQHVVSGAGQKTLNMDGAIIHKLQPG